MKSRRGFTLIEILVVVGLIMFLAAFVIVAAVRFGNNSRVNATKALLQRLGMGINKYYGEYRVYPSAPVDADVLAKKTNIYYYLTPHDDTSKTPTVQSPVCAEFKSGEVRLFGSDYWVVDPWGNKIVYYAQSRMQAEVGNYRMKSYGPNGIPDDADDISLSKVNY